MFEREGKQEKKSTSTMNTQMGSALPREKLDRNNFASWEYKMYQYLVDKYLCHYNLAIGATSKEHKKIDPTQQLLNTQHGSKSQVG